MDSRTQYMLGSPGILVSHLLASFQGVSQLCLGCRRLGARTPACAAAVFPALLFRFFLAPSAKGSDWERGSHSSVGRASHRYRGGHRDSNPVCSWIKWLSHSLVCAISAHALGVGIFVFLRPVYTGDFSGDLAV